MTTQYSTLDSLALGDSFLTWKTSAGDWRKAPLSVLITFLESNLSFDYSLTKQASSPSATGFSVTILTGNTWLLLTPTAGFAAGTITLPDGVEGEIVSVSCTQAVTSLTVNSDDGVTAVTGAPSSLSANGFFSLRYDSVTDAWYRIG